MIDLRATRSQIFRDIASSKPRQVVDGIDLLIAEVERLRAEVDRAEKLKSNTESLRAYLIHQRELLLEKKDKVWATVALQILDEVEAFLPEERSE